MNIRVKITLAKKGQASDCLFCVKYSDLWERYFKSNPTAENDIEEMITKKQIYVALDEQGKIFGFMGIINNGCFRKFSYLSLIAVARNYRGQGIGRRLINQFEEIGFAQADRVFLLVSDFNTKAQSLYEELGYRQVGEIPDLFKADANEQLLVKYKI